MCNKKGQMLIEVLVAMGTGIIIMAAVTNLFIDVQKSSIINRQKARANNLVQEAMEAVRSIRYSGWSEIATNGVYYPIISGNAWRLQPGQEEIDGLFKREIVISSVYRIAGPNDPNFLKIVPAGTPGAKEDHSTKEITVRVSWDTPREQEIIQKTYLTRYLGNNLITQTTQTDFNAGDKVDTQVVAAPPPPPDNGSVTLVNTAGPDTYYGNQFLLESTSGINRLNHNSYRCSMRFTAQASKTVSRLRLYIFERVSSPTYRFGIQTDSGGLPSGTWLGYGDSAPAGTGWREVTLTVPATLTAGQIYHLVVQYQSGSIGPNRYINIQRSAPLNLLYPYNNNPDVAANTLWYDGASWSVQNYQPIYVLRFSDNTYEGNPYFTSAIQYIYAGNYYGEKFTITGGNKTVTRIGFYVARIGIPLDYLTVTLQDVTGGNVIESGRLASPLEVGTTFSWITYTFTTPRTLQNGRTYRIYLSSPLTILTGSYLVYQIENTNSSEYNGINYDGINSVYSYSDSYGLIFTDYNYYDIGGYRFTIPGTGGGYAPSGTFTSSVIDTGGSVAFNTLDFEGNTPTGTSLGLQLATSSSPFGPWNFVGPDGTAGSYYTLTSIKAVHLDYTIGRYIRYRAYFSTSNSSVTPSLDAVYINYSP